MAGSFILPFYLCFLFLCNHHLTTLKNLALTFVFQWLAPETITAEDVPYTEQSDVYAFGSCWFHFYVNRNLTGVVLWEVFTQKYPFDDLYEDPRYVKQCGIDTNGKPVFSIREMKVKKGIIEKNLRPASKFDDVPDEISEIIKQCWNKLAKNRPVMTHVVEQLCSLLTKHYNVQKTTNISQWDSSVSALSNTLSPVNARQRNVKDTTGVTLKTTKSVFFTEHVFSVCIVEGQRLWVGLASGTARVFSLPDLRVVSSLQCFSQQSRVKAFSFVSNNQTLWVVSDKGEVCVTNAHSMKIKRGQHTGSFTDVAFVPPPSSEKHSDDRSKAVGGCGFVFVANPEKNCVMVFDARKARPQDILKTIPGVDGGCLFALQRSSPNTVFVGGIGKVFVIDCFTLEVVSCVELSAKRTRCPEAMCFASNLLWICPAGSSSVVEVFTPDGTFVTSLKGHSGCVKSLCVVPGRIADSADSEVVLSGGFDGSVMAWRVVNCGASTCEIKCQSEISINRNSSVEGIVCGPMRLTTLQQPVSSENNGRSASDVVQHIRSCQVYCGMVCGELVQLSLDIKEAPPVIQTAPSSLIVEERCERPSSSSSLLSVVDLPVDDAPPPPDYDAPEPPCS